MRFPVSRPLIRMLDTQAELCARSSEVAYGVMVRTYIIVVRVRDREWIFHLFSPLSQSDKHLSLALMAWGLV